MKQSTIDFVVRQFGIEPKEVEGYHSGICYDRVYVNTKKAAEKVQAVCSKENRTANGGWYHGMPLGNPGHPNDKGIYDIMV